MIRPIVSEPFFLRKLALSHIQLTNPSIVLPIDFILTAFYTHLTLIECQGVFSL